MAAQLRSTVYVQDPDSHQTLTLDAGTSPDARLAALVTNPSAWVDGKLPRLPKTRDSGDGQSPTGDGQDDASGADSDATEPSDEDTKPAAKRAARKPARGRAAADEGNGGD